jgi:hypothetical protein
MDKISLDCPPSPNDIGAFRLSWRGPQNGLFRLTEEGPAGRLILYEGEDRASTVTGRRAGDYAYRVGVLDGAEFTRWSDPCFVTVKPPSLGAAFALFGVGLFVTLATAWLVVRGHRAHRRGEIG